MAPEILWGLLILAAACNAKAQIKSGNEVANNNRSIPVVVKICPLQDPDHPNSQDNKTRYVVVSNYFLYQMRHPEFWTQFPIAKTQVVRGSELESLNIRQKDLLAIDKPCLYSSDGCELEKAFEDDGPESIEFQQHPNLFKTLLPGYIEPNVPSPPTSLELGEGCGGFPRYERADWIAYNALLRKIDRAEKIIKERSYKAHFPNS